MRILVTGGAGFIGSHLIDRLMEANHEVICLDNFYTGHKRNVLRWLNHPYFELVRHDITEPIRLEVDQIYHLACPASPVHYQYNPVKTVKTNVLGTLNMLGLAKRVKARFFLASTSEVYGDPEVHPQPEEYRGSVNPIGIRSCYDEGKRMAETLAFDYHRQNDVDIRVVRIFNTYGPRMLENDGRVVSNFIVQALSGQPLTVYGDGSQTRSFCYVSDLVEGFIRLMNSNQTGPINLGNPGEYTILELAQTIQKMVNPDVAVQYKPLPQDDPRRRQPDITKAKEFLDWTPEVQLQAGLEKTIADFRDRMAANGTLSPNLRTNMGGAAVSAS
ncbi:MAG: SDR family oxidoreductase [Phormidesmis sp. RL_2_1]|nr:SDR family oxidoreductase [Phormidesmis sp. RL_2_1]